jgi:arsenite oxidase small subunit
MGTRKDFLDREMKKSVSSSDAPDVPVKLTAQSDASCTHVDERRVFLAACSTSLVAVATQWLTANPALAAPSDSRKPKSNYASSILTDEHGRPVQASSLKPLVNYLFHYPYVATPCLLLNLGRDVGGVGNRKSIVAFSAICSHKLAYPAKEVSFIRFQAKASTLSEAERIHCCADHSVYDPAAKAKVVAGPAPVALAAILLEHDAKTDTLTAVGTSGVEQFDAFFSKYEFKLGMEFGGRARNLTATGARLQELTQFCRNVAQC